MKICPLCKVQFSDDAEFCPNCKALLINKDIIKEETPENKAQRIKDWKFLIFAVPGFILFVYFLYWLMTKIL